MNKDFIFFLRKIFFFLIIIFFLFKLIILLTIFLFFFKKIVNSYLFIYFFFFLVFFVIYFFFKLYYISSFFFFNIRKKKTKKLIRTIFSVIGFFFLFLFIIIYFFSFFFNLFSFVIFIFSQFYNDYIYIFFSNKIESNNNLLMFDSIFPNSFFILQNANVDPGSLVTDPNQHKEIVTALIKDQLKNCAFDDSPNCIKSIVQSIDKYKCFKYKDNCYKCFLTIRETSLDKCYSDPFYVCINNNDLSNVNVPKLVNSSHSHSHSHLHSYSQIFNNNNEGILSSRANCSLKEIETGTDLIKKIGAIKKS